MAARVGTYFILVPAAGDSGPGCFSPFHHLTPRRCAGRTGAFTLPVTVVAGVPRPVLGEVPAYIGRSVQLTWTQAPGVSLAHFDVMRTGPDGAPLLVAQLAAGDRRSFSYTDFPRLEGVYTYQIVAVATDGRRAEGAARTTQVSLTPPALPDLSISAVDGLGLQLQWSPAQDPVGIAGYQVLLEDTEPPQVLAELPADVHTFRAILPVGEHKAELVVVDRAGNRMNSGPVVAIVTILLGSDIDEKSSDCIRCIHRRRNICCEVWLI